jgi:hypothetical protein
MAAAMSFERTLWPRSAAFQQSGQSVGRVIAVR